MRYAVVLHSDDGKRFGASVPDLPGCFGAGDTIDEAIEDVESAIEAHAELMVAEGLEVPEPSSPLEIARMKADPAAIWALVDVNVERFFGPAEKINITLPARTLRKIDAYAKQIGESRSSFLVKAAERAIAANMG